MGREPGRGGEGSEGGEEGGGGGVGGRWCRGMRGGPGWGHKSTRRPPLREKKKAKMGWREREKKSDISGGLGGGGSRAGRSGAGRVQGRCYRV